MNFDSNPFPEADTDRHAIWEMLVRRDIEAYVSADWDAHRADWHPTVFLGFSAQKKTSPDSWRAVFSSLADYGAGWVGGAREELKRISSARYREEIFRATTLRDIDINGDLAVAHKKFDGVVRGDDGAVLSVFDWQTVYLLQRQDGRWWITGFVGHLPHGASAATGTRGEKLAPASSQHRTAGPFSPVLEVSPARLVVISGQAAQGPGGEILGTSIEDQTRATLENCRKQLAAAGVGLKDVFKVNAFLTDIENWPAFNAVYSEIMPEPRPVRTTVETGLLTNLLVEIEMWAVKP